MTCNLIVRNIKFNYNVTITKEPKGYHKAELERPATIQVETMDIHN